MQKSTPLDHLRRGGDEGSEAAEAQQMMDHAVQDLEEENNGPPLPEPMPGYPPQEPNSFNPRMQQPPGYEQFGGGGGGGNRGPHPGWVGGPPPPPFPRGHPGNMYPGGPSLENDSLSQRIMTETKEPLLVSILVIILSSSQVQQLISRFLPMSSENPLLGLVIRAALAGAAFYLLRRFIPT